MNQGTVITCTEQGSKYGGQEKICEISLDGQQGTVKVYAKSQTKAGKAIGYYPAVQQGARVELTPKNNGAGYFIAKVTGTVPVQEGATTQANNGTDPKALKKAQAEYIETKAGQLFYAYTCLQEKFGDLIITEETARAFASTIIISLDREGPK